MIFATASKLKYDLCAIKFSFQHIRHSLVTALRHGTSPHQLALTCALGVTIGIFPIWGTTTWICLALAVILRLNVVILQLVNYTFFPLQLLLIYPFIKTGVSFFDLSFPYEGSQFLDALKNNFWAVVSHSGAALLSGVGIWALTCMPVFLLVYYGTFYFFKKAAAD